MDGIVSDYSQNIFREIIAREINFHDYNSDKSTQEAIVIPAIISPQ